MEKTIKCPKCKAVQPHQPVCQECGFDIRAHYLKLKKQREAASGGAAQPQKKIKCPACGKVQPLQAICSECSYDIKSHVLKARKDSARGAAKDAPGMEATVQMSSGPEPSAGIGASAPGSPSASGSGSLLSIGDLFSKSVEMYKRRALSVLLVWLVGVLITLAAAALLPAIGAGLSAAIPDLGGIVMVVTGALGAIAGFIAYSVAIGALIYSVTDERTGLKAALRNGWRMKWSFAWMGVVFGFLIVGGLLFFIVPAVIMSVFFVFSFFILAVEDVRGMNAMLKSREYFRGRGWTVLLSLFVVWLVSSALGGVPFIGPILSIAFMPFMMFYIFILYGNLRETAPELDSFSAGFKDKAVYLSTALAGLIVVPLIAFYAANTYMQSHYGMDARSFLSMGLGGMAGSNGRSNSFSPGETGGKTFSSELELVLNGRSEKLVFDKELSYSGSKMSDPDHAILELLIPGEEQGVINGKIVITMDATQKGKHIATGEKSEESWYSPGEYKDIGESTGEGRRAAMFYVAPGGHVFFPESACIIELKSPYKGSKRSKFSGEIKDCDLGSSRVSHTINSMKFKIMGIVPR